MRAKILLSTAFALAAFNGFAQKTSNKAFAITGDGNIDYLWMNIRQVDLGTGKVDKSNYLWELLGRSLLIEYELSCLIVFIRHLRKQSKPLCS